MSQLDTENTMESESSPQRHLKNLMREIDQAPLKSPPAAVPIVISISDSEDEKNVDGDGENNVDGDGEKKVIVIDSDGDENYDENYYENERNRKSLNRYNRRLKYKARRAINMLLNYNRHLTREDIMYLESKQYEIRRGKGIKAIKRVSRVESERPRSEKQILRGIESLRRRYLEAIRTSYEIIHVWLGHDGANECDILHTDVCMGWANPFILNDYCVSVARGPDGEIESNDLDFLVQEGNFSDSESSSCESEISSGENEHTSDIYFDDGECHQHESVNQFYMNDHNITNKSYSQNGILQQRLQRHRRRLKRRQQLRDRFKICQLQPGSSAGPDGVCVSDRNQPSPPTDIIITPALDDEESCINDKLPCRRNSRRIVETNSLSSETATSSSHAITNNLLTTPVMWVQRRSRSRTRNHCTPRRFCTVSPPSSRARIISQEQMRTRSRSPLHVRRSPTRPLVPTTPRLSPSQKPRSHSSDTTTATDIGASTVTTTTAGRPHLSQAPPEALGSTLQRVSTDGGGGTSATLSQVALSLLELSEQ